MIAFRYLALVLLFEVGSLGFLLALPYNKGLKVGFYKDSCPNVELIVHRVVKKEWNEDKDIAAGVLRIQLHDCFVRGCDASVLLNSTKRHKAEKDAEPNQTLDGFQVFDKVKEALEKECPGIVSCADIIALTARDATSLAATISDSGKTSPYRNLWKVECGRRDGVVSLACEAPPNLPEPKQSFEELKKLFNSKGLTARDMVVGSGAHAIGRGHCFSFDKRVRNYNSVYDVDPTLNYNYALTLRKICKSRNNETEMVPGSEFTFDNKYYGLVRRHKGLFHSDAQLLVDKETRDYVLSRAKLPQSVFFRDFGAVMVKMGSIGVLTGQQGQIRKHCALVNH